MYHYKLVYELCKHSITSVDISMKSNTFALQNIKQRIWQAVQILKDTASLHYKYHGKGFLLCEQYLRHEDTNKSLI